VIWQIDVSLEFQRHGYHLQMIGLRLIFLAIGLAAAAEATTLAGYIRNATDGEEVGLSVVALPGLQLGGLANDRGYFAIRNVPAGRHLLVVSHIGYQSYRDSIDVTDDVLLEIRLRSEAIMGEETVITADRDAEAELERLIQTSFLTIAPQRLQQLPATGEADLLRSLQLLPGIQAASDISSGLYVRGGGPDQTLILLDDIPLYNPSHAFGFFSTFNPEAVRDVQLYKGAYPANYGGNLGAVLDVSNRDGNREKTSLSGGVSLVSTRLLVEGPLGEGSWMMSGRRTYLDPLLAAIRSSGTDVPNYFFYDLNTKITQPLGNGGDNLLVSAYFGRDDLDFDLNEAETFFNIRWGNRAAMVRWTHLFDPALFGELTLSSSEYESTTDLSFFDTPVLFQNQIEDLTLNADLEYFLRSDNTLTGGLRATKYNFKFISSFNSEDGLDLNQSPTLLEFYLQDDAQLSMGTHVRLGVRASRFSQADEIAIMPRVSISQPVADDWRIKFGGGLYRQYLQLVTTEGFSGGDFWVPLDETVGPASSWQTVAGVEWEPTRKYKLTAELYYTDLDGLVVIDNNTTADNNSTRSEDIFKSDGTGYATGAEFFFEKRTGRLRGWLGYTLGRTRRTFDEVDGGRSFSPKYDRRHDASLVMSYRLSTWRLGSSLVYATGQAFTPAAARYTLRNPATAVEEDLVLAARRNSARLLPYHRLDLSARRQIGFFGGDAEVYLQIFNVYSRRNEWFVQYDTANPETEPKVVKQLPVIPSFGLEVSF
jgi:hypothetical protein